MGGLPEDFAEVVRAQHTRTLGWVIATSEPCLAVRDDEARRIARNLRAVDPDDLRKTDLPESWFAAVLVCPGDQTDEVAAWARTLDPRHLERIKFYCHPKADLFEVFAAWRDAGLPSPRTVELTDVSFKAFHRLFGLDYNWRVYLDARPSQGPG